MNNQTNTQTAVIGRVRRAPPRPVPENKRKLVGRHKADRPVTADEFRRIMLAFPTGKVVSAGGRKYSVAGWAYSRERLSRIMLLANPLDEHGTARKRTGRQPVRIGLVRTGTNPGRWVTDSEGAHYD